MIEEQATNDLLKELEREERQCTGIDAQKDEALAISYMGLIRTNGRRPLESTSKCKKWYGGRFGNTVNT